MVAYHTLCLKCTWLFLFNKNAVLNIWKVLTRLYFQFWFSSLVCLHSILSSIVSLLIVNLTILLCKQGRLEPLQAYFKKNKQGLGADKIKKKKTQQLSENSLGDTKFDGVKFTSSFSSFFFILCSLMEIEELKRQWFNSLPKRDKIELTNGAYPTCFIR